MGTIPTKKVLLGVIAGSLLISGTVFAKTTWQEIAVQYANIKLVVDGKAVPTIAEPFIFNKNVYVPAATIANTLGIHQRWDNTRRSVIFQSDPNQPDHELTPADYEITMGERVELNMPSNFKYNLDYATQLAALAGPTFDHPSYQLVHTDQQGKKTNIPIPQMEIDGVKSYQYFVAGFDSMTSAEIGIDGANRKEFAMQEVFGTSGNTKYYITAFRFDPDKLTLTKINTVLVSEGPYTASITYSHQGNFMVKLYEREDNHGTLKGVRFYHLSSNWQFTKVEEVVR